MAKITLSEAKRLSKEIGETETKLFELLKEADAKGVKLKQCNCNGTLDRFNYYLTQITIDPVDIED